MPPRTISAIPAMTQVFSKKEISRHCSQQDAWVVVDGCVYDVSGFLPSHPGGLGVLAGHLGTDISTVLRSPDFHLHSCVAYQILDHCCIGVVEGTQPNTQVSMHPLENVQCSLPSYLVFSLACTWKFLSNRHT